MFICPVCKNELNKTGKSFICSNGHCFDMAKSGYVNLLLKSTGGNHGDNKLMVSARRDFLDKGYYDYDYEKPSERTEAALTAATSDDELEAKLRGMGLNVRPKKKTLTPEELQAEVM